jgi:hypothetical protein
MIMGRLATAGGGDLPMIMEMSAPTAPFDPDSQPRAGGRTGLASPLRAAALGSELRGKLAERIERLGPV